MSDRVISPMRTLILASASAARRKMLHHAGLEIDIFPAHIDETAIKTEYARKGKSPEDTATALAMAKAREISQAEQDAYVIGADQLLVLDGQWLDKARNTDEARQRLEALRGCTHSLISAVAVACADSVLWSHVETAHITMRDFSDRFLEAYLNSAHNALTATVGAYELEGHGAQLMERVEGDYFTVLGMPLLPLLDFLRRENTLLT